MSTISIAMDVPSVVRGSELWETLRCPLDSSALVAQKQKLQCLSCQTSYAIDKLGIVHMLSTETLSGEEKHEIQFRDKYATDTTLQVEMAWEKSCVLEIYQHIAALCLPTDRSCLLLEIGAGKGRFTTRLLSLCRGIVAVDFSLGSLHFLARRLPADAPVLLVHADATKLRVSPRSFQRALSTTPLDSRSQRMAVHERVSLALCDDGLWVYSTEAYRLRDRLRNVPRVERYEADRSGSVFFRMRREEVTREAHPFFRRVSARRILDRIPKVKIDRLNRIAAHLPGIGTLGDLWLATARSPIRELFE